MALVETLQDNFQWETLDTGKWSTSLSANASEISVSNLYLHITHGPISEYNALSSLTTYDLTGSQAVVHVLNAGNQSITSHEVILGIQKDSSNKVWLDISNGNLSAYKLVASVQSQIGVSVTYDSTAHAWLRIRESLGTIYFDTSPDASTWTNRWSVANPFAITVVTPYLQTGCWQNESSGSFADFTDFNCTPSQFEFAWKGITWMKRLRTGPPQYNNQWSTANISAPDANDYLTLSLTNSSGSSPIGAEIYTKGRGYGYGVYQCTIGTRVDNLYPATDLGGMFVFDATQPPHYAEIDMGEGAPYQSNPIRQILFNHTYSTGGTNDTFVVSNANASSNIVRTYKCIWSPTQLEFFEYAGADTSGQLLNHFIHTNYIPTPKFHRVMFNIWVQNHDTPASAPAVDFILQNFSFTPLSGRVVTAGRAPSSGLYLPRRTNNYASTPDSAALSITGDIDIQACIRPTFGLSTPFQAILGKYNTAGNQRSYRFILETTGVFVLGLSAAGTSFTAASSAAPNIPGGSPLWVRVTWRQSDGRVQFFTAPASPTPPTSWTQLGSDLTLSVTSIFDNNQVLAIGALSDGTSPFAGMIYRVIIKNGIDGVTAFDAEFYKVAVGAGSFTESSSNGALVTINTSGSPAAAIKGRNTASNRSVVTR